MVGGNYRIRHDGFKLNDTNVYYDNHKSRVISHFVLNCSVVVELDN